tara:strand:+ start:700 stop:1332 length:633 start_codon:yes stop_codon:yes gene_type:complete
MITQIGNHRVQRSDVMNGIDSLMAGFKADFLYSDPPWGQGNLRYWQTINKRHTGREKADIDFSEFLPFYFDMAYKHIKDLAVIEYGVGWRQDVILVCQQYGFTHHGTYTSRYGSAAKLLPLDVHIISKSGSFIMPDEKYFSEKCYELRGQHLVNFIFDYLLPKDAELVLDPMCGMGYTAQAALNNGCIFFGNELNEKRLEKTIARLRRSL